MDLEKYLKEANRHVSDLITATARRYKKTQRYKPVIWLTTQLTGLKKKNDFLENWLMD